MPVKQFLVFVSLFLLVQNIVQAGLGLIKKDEPYSVHDTGKNPEGVLLETEFFLKKGGWVIDAQFVDQMGSPYLLAHGLGKPVEDAYTTVSFDDFGEYHVWVRTKDWAPFPKGPGEFKLFINGEPLDKTFGSTGTEGWQWCYGGTVKIEKTENEVRLKDLTGFEGRCDAIYFTKLKQTDLPNTVPALVAFRKAALALPQVPHNEGEYDLVVVGGGVAGICAAVQASRLGLKTALINNRPVLGGNSSSEIRIPTDGDTFRNKYPKIGRIVREVDNYNAGVGGSEAKLYGDSWRKKVVMNEKNITLFEHMHVNQIEIKNSRIQAVIALNLETLEEHRFTGTLFSDCTGDAVVGRLAGAIYRYGRESRSETGESLAPEEADELTMGTSNQWYSRHTRSVSDFPVQEWMFRFTDDYHFELFRSRWNWETGFGNFHIVNQAEEIRDHNFRAIYSNWAYLKTCKPEKFKNHELEYLSHIAGKRESYRLLGDIVLCQQDIDEKKHYPDAVVTTTWGIDLHYPDTINSLYFPGKEFVAYAVHPSKQKEAYTFPYRCLYSRNVENLFMAGRNISVTHVALGAVRVQRCTGMMGEVVGLASFICNQYNCNPRDVYEKYWNEFINLIE